MVSLSLGNFTGFGEAPAIVYYNVTVEKMMEDLESKRAMVEKFALTDPARYWHYLHHLFPNNPFLVSKLDANEFKENPSILNDNLSTISIFEEKRFVLLNLLYFTFSIFEIMEEDYVSPIGGRG